MSRAGIDLSAVDDSRKIDSIMNDIQGSIQRLEENIAKDPRWSKNMIVWLKKKSHIALVSGVLFMFGFLITYDWWRFPTHMPTISGFDGILKILVAAVICSVAAVVYFKSVEMLMVWVILPLINVFQNIRRRMLIKMSCELRGRIQRLKESRARFGNTLYVFSEHEQKARTDLDAEWCKIVKIYSILRRLSDS